MSPNENPPGTKKTEMLEFYSKVFDTIEIDATTEQQEKLREFTESIGQENSPMRESFIERAKRFFS